MDKRLDNVVTSIKGNEKRMEKLNKVKDRFARYAKCRGFVVAEAQALHVKLSEDEIIRAVCMIV